MYKYQVSFLWYNVYIIEFSSSYCTVWLCTDFILNVFELASNIVHDLDIINNYKINENTQMVNSIIQFSRGISVIQYLFLKPAVLQVQGSRVCTLVRAVASHWYGPGLNPRPGAISGLNFWWFSTLLEGFSPGSRVFLPQQKPACSWFQLAVSCAPRS